MNLSQKSDLSIAIFQPDIAQNLGAMLRLAACLGVKVEIIEPCGFPLSSKILKRTAMDYIEISLIRHHNSYGDFKKGKSGRLVLLSTKSKKSIWDFSFKKNDTLLVGQESAGVPDYVIKDSDISLRVPMVSKARSLNVVTAAAISLGEAVRQMRSND